MYGTSGMFYVQQPAIWDPNQSAQMAAQPVTQIVNPQPAANAQMMVPVILMPVADAGATPMMQPQYSTIQPCFAPAAMYNTATVVAPAVSAVSAPAASTPITTPTGTTASHSTIASKSSAASSTGVVSPYTPETSAPAKGGRRQSARPTTPDGLSENKVPMRVSQNTQLKGVAGALAKRMRLQQTVHVQAMGQGSVTQAMKGFQLAAHFLEQDEIAIQVQIDFVFAQARQQDEQHPALRFLVSGKPAGQQPRTDSVFTVSDQLTCGRVAAQIAKQARSCGSPLLLRIDPAQAAFNVAAKALALSRNMIQDDDLDIRMHPTLSNSAATAEYLVTVHPRVSD